VFWTLAGTCNVDQIPGEAYPPGMPKEALAYASIPIAKEDRIIEAGERLPFRVSLGAAPFFFDDETELFPYVLPC